MTLILPYTFINGTVADANQVDANFNAIIAAINNNQRTKLTTNTIFYVSPTGTDTGIPTSPTSPAATIQYVFDLLQNNYDLGAFGATIQLADGTYTQSTALNGTVLGEESVANLTIQGNLGAPANVVIVGAPCFSLNNGAACRLQGVQLTSSTDAVVVAQYSKLTYRSVDFGIASQAHIHLLRRGFAFAIGDYSISGGAANHWNVSDSSLYAEQATNLDVPPTFGIPTITLSGTPSFSDAFARVGNLAFAKVFATFVGSANGTRYALSGNGVIHTGGQPTTYLPGSGAGTTASGGQYT